MTTFTKLLSIDDIGYINNLLEVLASRQKLVEKKLNKVDFTI
jgi:hypothetical protein